MKNIKITSPNKILFPKDKITKLDVIKYYYEVSNLMLPFIKYRLLSVIRCHDSIENSFIKKHPTTDKKMINIYKIEDEEYFYLDKKEQIIYQVQSGTLEFHTRGGTIKKINKPDMMVFDLDPDEKLSLVKLRSAVKKVKSILDELNLESFLKTSGGKGYHIVVPFTGSKNWDSFYEFSKNIALIIEKKWPKEFTTNLKKDKRKGKIFIDYLRNNNGATCVAPYSIRAKEKAPLSFPIHWKDLDKIKPNEININNYKKYLNSSWDNFLKVKQKLK